MVENSPVGSTLLKKVDEELVEGMYSSDLL